jgi:Big-like domain-containing protein
MAKDDEKEAKSMKPVPRTWWLSLAVVMCIALSAGSAWAQGQGLAAVGPLLPANGYPSFYTDHQGLQLEPCLVPPSADPAVVPGADPCGLFGTVVTGAPIVYVSNFPVEFFYNRVVGVLKNINGGNKSTLVIGLEGGFTAPLPPTVGQNVVFARLRMNVTGGLTPGGTYTFTHPYGTLIYTADAAGNLPRNAGTIDQGCLIAPCGAFDQVLTTNIFGPFIQAVSPLPPPGFIGDPNVDQTITGSPLGTNFYQIDGPNIGGPGINTVRTDVFAVTGKLYTGPTTAPALTIERTSYSRNATGTTVNVFAHAAGAAGGVTATVAGTTITLSPDPAIGRWFGQASVPAAQPGATVLVTASTGGLTPLTTTLSSVLVDEVTIDAAAYDPVGKVLTVQAHSGDVVTAPLLTVQSDETPPVVLGTVASGALLTLNTPAPPAGVVVVSALGGFANRDVDASPGAGQTTGSLNLVSNLNPSEIAQPVTFTATIVATGAPTGTITFKEGATVLGTGTVVNKAASFVTSSLAIGSHTISASYSGDAVFAASTSNAVIQVVNKGTVTVTLGSNPNPSTIGQPVLFSASVTAATVAAGTPTGSVTFSEGGTNLGTVPLVGGSATISVSTLGPGSHLIIATYSGDATFKAGVSPIYTQVLNKANSTTSVVAVPNPATRKVVVNLTATVGPTPTSTGGIVTFTSTASNGQVTTLGTGTVDATGKATLTFTTANNRGTFTITAAYGGNASLNPSSGTTSLVIN